MRRNTTNVHRVAIALLLSALLLTPLSAVSAQTSGVRLPVTGTFTDALGGTGTFAGTFNLQRFAVRNGQLGAVGTLTGTLTNSLGAILGNVVNSIFIPVTNITGTCEILHLELGPLDLNLLGLMVHLDQVVLDITAQSGPGNLLGNLLCAIANLLNSDGALTSIARLLNQILGAL